MRRANLSAGERRHEDLVDIIVERVGKKRKRKLLKHVVYSSGEMDIYERKNGVVIYREVKGLHSAKGYHRALKQAEHFFQTYPDGRFIYYSQDVQHKIVAKRIRNV